MGNIGQVFVLIAFVVPIALIVWHVFSSLARITRGIEDIALTLRRIEQGGPRLTPQSQPELPLKPARVTRPNS
jgi:hypothetical protein